MLLAPRRELRRWMFAVRWPARLFAFEFNAAHYFSLSTGILVEMATLIMILSVWFVDSFGIARFFQFRHVAADCSADRVQANIGPSGKK